MNRPEQSFLKKHEHSKQKKKNIIKFKFFLEKISKQFFCSLETLRSVAEQFFSWSH